MIIGIGNDLVDIRRIEKLLKRFGEKLLTRLFTEAEICYAKQGNNLNAILAKRFAAKEAFAKAMGNGIGKKAKWREIGVVNDALGKPRLVITGIALQTLHGLVPEGKNIQLHLSLSDEYPLAQAFVIISAA